MSLKDHEEVNATLNMTNHEIKTNQDHLAWSDLVSGVTSRMQCKEFDNKLL